MSEQQALDRQSAALQYRLAMLWQARGQIERAIAGYQEAIRITPQYVAAHLELGQLMLQHRSPEEAIAVYRHASELNPSESCFTQRLEALAALRTQSPQVSAPSENYAIEDAGAGRRHIVLYTDCSGIYGVGQWNHALILALHEAQYLVTCVQERSSDHLVEERARRGIRHCWRTAENLYATVQPVLALEDDQEPTSILESLRPDLIIFSDGAPMSSLTAKLAAIRLAIPYAVVVHCVTEAWAEQYARYLDALSRVFMLAEAVIAVSHASLQLLRERFGLPVGAGLVIAQGRAAPYFATPAPTVRSRMRQEMRISPEAVVICTVASMELRKGFQYLLKAIKVLRDSASWPRLHFLWVGTGTLEPQLRAAVEGLGAREHVTFLGERSDVVDVLCAADIFALPSQFEGMPAAVIEAMAAAIPVIATAVNGVPEALGDTGKLLADPRRAPEMVVSELALTIEVWATDPDLRRTIGLAGRHRAEALFTESRMLHALMHVVECALPNGAAAGSGSGTPKTIS